MIYLCCHWELLQDKQASLERRHDWGSSPAHNIPSPAASEIRWALFPEDDEAHAKFQVVTMKLFLKSMRKA